jgi:hypothetical protein
MTTLLSPRKFKNWLAAYSQYTEGTEAPSHFHLWCGMWAIGSVLARKVWIDMGAFDWVPNQYIVFVGEPGVVTKSTSIRLAEELIRMSETVKFGSNSSTWQMLAKEMANATVADVLTMTPTSSLSLAVSELGSFLDLQNREQVDFLVDIWDGHRGVWQRTTVGGGSVKIERPCLNLIGGTTPAWIRANYQGNMVGGGLSSRMILVLGEEKSRLIAYPGLQGIGTKNDMKADLVEDLKRIGELSGVMTLSQDALDWGTLWYESHQRNRDARQLKGERFEHYYARKQTHLHKIAMILSAATSDAMIINKRNLQAANGILLDMERGYAKALEHTMSGTPYANNRGELCRVISAHGSAGADERAIFQEVAAVMSGFDFKRALTDLIREGSVREIVGGSSSRYRWAKEETKSARPDDIQNERTLHDD